MVLGLFEMSNASFARSRHGHTAHRCDLIYQLHEFLVIRLECFCCQEIWVSSKGTSNDADRRFLPYCAKLSTAHADDVAPTSSETALRVTLIRAAVITYTVLSMVSTYLSRYVPHVHVVHRIARQGSRVAV